MLIAGLITFKRVSSKKYKTPAGTFSNLPKLISSLISN